MLLDIDNFVHLPFLVPFPSFLIKLSFYFLSKKVPNTMIELCLGTFLVNDNNKKTCKKALVLSGKETSNEHYEILIPFPFW